MELSFFVHCMIIIFTIVGTNGNSTVSDTCAKYAEKLCKCNVVDHQVVETPLKMCSYKEEENELCKPCRDVAQENATCAECPELACPACNGTSIGLTYEETTSSVVENGHGHRNHSREKRLAHRWCRVENELLSGRFTCKAWPDRKECLLRCAVGDDYMLGNSHHFSCYRKENAWRLEVKPCGMTSGEGKSNKISAEMGLPLHRIVSGPGHALRLFLPIGHVNVHRVQGDYDQGEPQQGDGTSNRRMMGSFHRTQDHNWNEKRAHKRSYTDLPPLSIISSADFEFDDEEAISATRIMPLEYLYDYKLLDPESYWMLTNASSISYAPYKDDLQETTKEELSNSL